METKMQIESAIVHAASHAKRRRAGWIERQ
jgi:hypothetical protein